jgi:hypothetical protein
MFNTFNLYLKKSKSCDFSKQNINKSIEIQNNYSIQQRKNPKTSKALSVYIGEDNANSFINNILFPTFNL